MKQKHKQTKVGMLLLNREELGVGHLEKGALL